MKILIKNGRIIDPEAGIDQKGDLLIENGKIAKIAASIKEEKAEVIDAAGKLVVPGLIDMHTHLREPGREDKETIKTGLRAAVKGGFTAVCPMPNTEPPCDNQAQVKFLKEKAEQCGLAKIWPIGSITRGRQGKAISDMTDLKEAGARAVSDDGDSVEDAELMRRALEYASMLDLLVISHCEDKKLAGEGVMHEGYWSTVLGMSPIPSVSESLIVERDIRLAALAGARLHIAHVSTEESVNAIRQAKKEGITVTAEVTPHHITLKDEDLKTYDTNLKVNPPLRSVSDIKALKEGLKDGTIDVIATDHAPHLVNEKEKEFDYAPFGMIGLETALSLSAALIDEGVLDWKTLIEKMSVTPGKILQVPGGTLAEGACADVTIIDPDKEWVYTKESIESRSQNSPFLGWKLKAQVTDVIVGGKIVLREGEIT
jgi:dihydroorotase